MKSIQYLRGALRTALATLAACGAMQAHALVVGSWGTSSEGSEAHPESSPRHFVMNASEGHISMADGVHVYMWGYGLGQSGLMQYSGPTMLAREGDFIEVDLYNNLPVVTSIMFPGQVVSEGGPGTGANVLALQIPPGEHETIKFQATHAGTYTYQSGSRTSLQIEMGMMGALIVYPRDDATLSPGQRPEARLRASRDRLRSRDTADRLGPRLRHPPAGVRAGLRSSRRRERFA